ncbi:MAG: hypothetical protein CMN32_03140 [Saprospirales bacterium]|nr:hypothetical protein [Saprospirales bacterium]
MKINPALFALALLGLTSATIAQGTEKTLVKSFRLDNISQINLGIGSDVEVKQWNEPHLRILMTIKLDNGNEYLLKSLIANGRYNLKGTVENGIFSIFAPELVKEIKFKDGQKLYEVISLEVYVPEGVQVQLEELAYESIGNDLESH